jgi:hypothetical protein
LGGDKRVAVRAIGTSSSLKIQPPHAHSSYPIPYLEVIH